MSAEAQAITGSVCQPEFVCPTINADLVNVIATARRGKAGMIVTNRPDEVKAVLKSWTIKIVRPEDMI